jgi:hypothetical protein
MEEEKKYCCNCKYVSTEYNEEPCKSCCASSNWENRFKFKTGDLVVSKNDPCRKNLYVYLRNKWVLRVPNYVTTRSSYIISSVGYRGSEMIDKLIRNSNAECEWLDNLEYASPEIITQHDDRAENLYIPEPFGEWFSKLIEEERDQKQKIALDEVCSAKEFFTFFDRKPKVFTTPNMIKNVIFSDPATIIFWEDGTKTVVKTQDGEKYDKEKGFAMAVCKKVFGNERDYYHVFKRWMRKGKEVK